MKTEQREPRTHFEYSVRGPLVKNAVVGEILKVEPSHVIIGGAQKAVKGGLHATVPFTSSVWMLSTKGVVASADINVHARSLLVPLREGIAALRPHIREWSADERFTVFCEVQGHGGAWLEPYVLKALGALDVPLFVEVHALP